MPRIVPPTPGTRIAAWIFPALTLYLGLAYRFGADTRVQSPAFDAAQRWLSIPTWGTVFIVVALVKFGCLAFGGRRVFIVAMCAGMGLYAAWGVFFAASVVEPVASLGAPAWPFAMVGFHIAFMATLTEPTRKQPTRKQSA